MLDAIIANKILNGLFAMGLKREEGETSEMGAQIYFGSNLYLGLLTELPNSEGEVKEPWDHDDQDYMRIKLNSKNRLTKAPFMSGSMVEEDILTNEDGDDYRVVKVQNNGAILFPETTATYQIVGFGIFENEKTAKKPMIWGPIDEAIDITPGQVPVIRDGAFQVSLI